ncbi:hypothetical protein VCR5J5_1530046 [Vibrio crassostreae]|uniref:Uncharacterized protein n=1 Tax=Vibrio crassostreae TaxID=246167 RepID=A0A822MR22_9VIBR|nr:hypothetical protein VCR5J5_1530046 [Vibrio crassostreae]
MDASPVKSPAGTIFKDRASTKVGVLLYLEHGKRCLAVAAGMLVQSVRSCCFIPKSRSFTS